jgi:NAD(P)H-quinone oxidoreductase subunit I
MFKDIFTSFFAKHDTQLYPVERISPPERYRGVLSYDPSTCSGCSLCVKDCPADAIELVILHRAAKQYVFKYRKDRCIYCGQCVVSCKMNCLAMSSQDWEHASLDQNFLVYYGKEKDIAKYLAPTTEAPAEATGD